MAFRHVSVFAAALLVGGPTGLAGAQSPCTAEQGQALIDEGRYKQAIKEFTCLIDAQPTEADGYRGASRRSFCSVCIRMRCVITDG